MNFKLRHVPHDIEQGIRGGISTITKRHATANNKYMKGFDPKKKSVFIKYLDKNNLYGSAMCFKMPFKDFEWMSPGGINILEESLKEDDFDMLPPSVLEVDLVYPKELHNHHNDYPLAPEKIKLNKVEKLVPNLFDKKKYVLHHELLKYYLKMSMKLQKIHRVITFEEKDFMSGYVNLNTRMRIQGKTKFEKDFYKLMNNSLYGKTVENIRKRVNVSLVTGESQLEKFAKKPNYKGSTIFSDHLVAVHMGKTKVKFNQPIYIGFSILELSKLIMYEYHYGFHDKKYGKRSKLLFTDTDSLCYEIRTKDYYKDIEQFIGSHFDTSDVKPGHPSGIETGVNKKVLNKMKCETNCEEITEFVGLRSKLYSFIVPSQDNTSRVKCKGIKKSVIKKTISIDDLKSVLFGGPVQTRTMGMIRNQKHQLFTQMTTKVALSANDDKRHVLPDGVNTLALGHYKIANGTCNET